MPRVRVLVGTRKGSFILESDEARKKWDVRGPEFAGWELYHLKGSPVNPDRIFAAQHTELVRPAHPALRRRRQDVDARRQRVQVRHRPHHPPVVRRHAAPVGVRARLAPRALAHRRRHRLRRRRGRRALPLDRRRRDVATSSLACANHDTGPQWAPGAGGMCLHTIILDPRDEKRIVTAISAAGRLPQRRRRRDMAAHHQGPAVEGDPRPRRRGRPLRAPRRHEPVAPRRPLHAEALGRHAQRRRRRLLARGQRRPADRLRLRHRRPRARARHHLRRADQERLRALPARRRSCASTAAAAAATSGSR